MFAMARAEARLEDLHPSTLMGGITQAQIEAVDLGPAIHGPVKLLRRLMTLLAKLGIGRKVNADLHPPRIDESEVNHAPFDEEENRPGPLRAESTPWNAIP